MISTSKTTIALVGGGGAMGRMLGSFWTDAGYTVNSIDRREDPSGTLALDSCDLEEGIDGADIVVISVPVTALCEVAARIAPHMRHGQLLVDVTSVKMRPMQWMEECYAGPVIGAHPLFGPNPAREFMRVPLVRGLRSSEENAAQAETLFTSIGCAVFWTTAREHDEGVALAQSLNFTVSAAFFATLAANPQARPFLTPSFTRHLEAARKHLTQDTAMFCEFTSENPMYQDVLCRYRETLDRAVSGGLAGMAEDAAVWYSGGAM